ncbi:MAG: hypothetical protein HFG41_12340 [Coprococcus sp.]|nr:hypothetical protein [Coprococcus sp.]
MELIEELESLGVDIEEGMKRTLGDQGLYEGMLEMFADEVRTAHIRREDFDSGRLDVLEREILRLKGIAENLCLTPLFNAYVKTLEFLDDGQLHKARDVFIKTLQVQTAIVDCIEQQSTV